MEPTRHSITGPWRRQQQLVLAQVGLFLMAGITVAAGFAGWVHPRESHRALVTLCILTNFAAALLGPALAVVALLLAPWVRRDGKVWPWSVGLGFAAVVLAVPQHLMALSWTVAFLQV